MKTNVGVQRRSTSGLPIFDSLANAVSTVDNLLIGKLTGPDGTSLSFKSLNTRERCWCEWRGIVTRYTTWYSTKAYR